eukprot:6224841-Amphidinium_carterae.1
MHEEQLRNQVFYLTVVHTTLHMSSLNELQRFYEKNRNDIQDGSNRRDIHTQLEINGDRVARSTLANSWRSKRHSNKRNHDQLFTRVTT